MICLCGQTNSAQEERIKALVPFFKTNTGAAHVQYRSGALFLKKGCGEQYPYAEDIFYTASVPRESQPRFGPPRVRARYPLPRVRPRLRFVAPAPVLGAGLWP